MTRAANVLNLPCLLLLAALLPAACEDPHQILFDNPHDPLNPGYLPPGPGGVRVTGGEASRVISWNPPSTGAVRFDVERKLGAAGTFAVIGSVLPPATAFTDTSGIRTDTAYFYRVSTVSSGGNATPSTPVSWSLPFPSPSDVKELCVSPGAVLLSWSDNSSFESGFRIESSVNGGPYAAVALVPPDSTGWRATSLSAGNVYSYRVVAVTARNASAPSGSIALRSVTQPFELIWTVQTVSAIDMSSLAFSPDGRTLAWGGSPDVELRATDTGLRKGVLSHQAGITEWEIAFAPAGGVLAASHGSHVDIFDVAGGGVKTTMSWPGFGMGKTLSFDRTGSTLVCGSDSSLAVMDPGSGTVLHAFAGRQVFTFSRVSPDGLTIAAGSPSSPLALYRTSDGSVRIAIPQQATVMQIAYSPDGSLIAVTGAADQTVRLWSAATGALMRTLPGLTNGWSLAFSSDGKWVAASDMLIPPPIELQPTTGEARLWRVSDGALLATFPGNPFTGNVAIGPYGNLIAVGKAGAVDLWASAGTWVLAR